MRNQPYSNDTGENSRFFSSENDAGKILGVRILVFLASSGTWNETQPHPSISLNGRNHNEEQTRRWGRSRAWHPPSPSLVQRRTNKKTRWQQVFKARPTPKRVRALATTPSTLPVPFQPHHFKTSDTFAELKNGSAKSNGKRIEIDLENVYWFPKGPNDEGLFACGRSDDSQGLKNLDPWLKSNEVRCRSRVYYWDRSVGYNFWIDGARVFIFSLNPIWGVCGQNPTDGRRGTNGEVWDSTWNLGFVGEERCRRRGSGLGLGFQGSLARVLSRRVRSFPLLWSYGSIILE